jgi:hypothetical protein
VSSMPSQSSSSPTCLLERELILPSDAEGEAAAPNPGHGGYRVEGLGMEFPFVTHRNTSSLSAA